MIKTKTYNLLPLILFFIISSLKIIFLAIVPSLIIVFLILIQFPNILLVIFSKLTFFKYKKSPFKIFIIILIVVRSIDFIVRLNFQISIPMTTSLDESNLIFYFFILFSITISFLLSYLWLGIVALKYYYSIKSINIEPWIKKRYQLIGLSSIIYSLSIFIYYFIPYNVIGTWAFPNIIYGYILLGFTIFYSLSAFLGWVMPKPLKEFFNKDYKGIIEEDLSEAKLLEMIKNQLGENDES